VGEDGLKCLKPMRSKGIVSFRDYQTLYRISGHLDSGLCPAVVVHGGPGSTHDYLLSVATIADDGRPVVHYDQLGNSGSTHLIFPIGRFLDGAALPGRVG
jgi:L-proline amide hydrolase